MEPQKDNDDWNHLCNSSRSMEYKKEDQKPVVRVMDLWWTREIRRFSPHGDIKFCCLTHEWKGPTVSQWRDCGVFHSFYWGVWSFLAHSCQRRCKFNAEDHHAFKPETIEPTRSPSTSWQPQSLTAIGRTDDAFVSFIDILFSEIASNSKETLDHSNERSLEISDDILTLP
jgi:hypothetical protein